MKMIKYNNLKQPSLNFLNTNNYTSSKKNLNSNSKNRSTDKKPLRIFEGKDFIFNNYKVSSNVAINIYEKIMNKLLNYIRKKYPKKFLLDIKKKIISLIIEELKIKDKDIMKNMSEHKIIESNIKLFLNENNKPINVTKNISQFSSNPSLIMLSKCKSLYRMKKSNNESSKKKQIILNSYTNDSKKGKISIFNNSNYIIQSKKKKEPLKTEGNTIDKMDRRNIYNLKKMINSKGKKFNILGNFSLNNNMYNYSNKNSNSAYYDKGKTNNDTLTKKTKYIRDENSKEEKNYFKFEKDNEKFNSIQQLNLVKANLDEQLKKMFNFSYGNFLNDKESESSKSLIDITRAKK